MTNNNANLPAFPAVCEFKDGRELYEPGISRREYFAGLAMQGLMSVSDKGEWKDWGTAVSEAAKISVLAADAIINELSKQETP